MAPVRALLVYHPNDGTSQPPPVSSPSWGLDDGGAWKSQTPFPVYAISSDMGTQLIRQSSLYSGNMTDVPHGHEISEMAGGDSRDYVRLYTKISMSNDTGWPGVWAFVLVIVAALVIMLVITSATMHFLLRCQRYFLRLRVANGEVNLEALGIVRLTVSEEGIKKLPLFIYRCETTPSSPIPIDPKREYQNTREQYGSSDDFVTIPGPSDVLRINPTLVSRYSDAGDSLLNDGANNFRSGSQPTCAICLDDFVSGSTPVRELPCEHIFHPECIDSFLGNHSSLCPMCKKSVLPAGYCPVVITNAMVRRERNIRALRSRINLSEDPRRGEVSRPIFQTISIQLRRIISQPFSIQQENRSNMSLQPQIVLTAMRSLGEVGRHDSILSHDAPQNIPHTLNRQEFAQQRIRGLTAMQIFVDEPEITRTRQQPKCKPSFTHLRLILTAYTGRETLVKAFPGFS
jgi:hypothetical protein